MRKLFLYRQLLVTVFTIACIFTLSATETLHRLATYNIRYVAEKNGDTGSKSWTERRSSLMRLIRDYDFDVCGLNEVTGNNVDPITGVSQLQDLRDTLTEYSFIPYERSGTGNYSYNVVIYKTTKYECLDHGCFWLSATPDKPSKGWTDDFQRLMIWTKLKVINTGEIFYFCSTHVSGSSEEVVANSAQVIVDRLNSIVGGYPVIFGGDFNALGHKIYDSAFYNAATTAQTSQSIPIPNINYTYTAWSKTGSQLAIDQLYYRNMKVHDFYIITEEYGRGLGPSDHYPVLVTCNLSGENPLKSIYINKSVLATGNGSKQSPFASINEAITVSQYFDTLKVTADSYSEAITLSTSLVIKGGYNSTFSKIIGKTTIDGDIDKNDTQGIFSDNLPQLINVSKYSLRLQNFILKNAYTETALNGGGLYTTGCTVDLKNVEFRNNKTGAAGAGLYAVCTSFSMDSCVFEGNIAGNNGGGAYINTPNSLYIRNNLFKNNEAKSGGALTCIACKNSYFQSNTFMENINSQFGTVYLPAYSGTISHFFLNNTFANNELKASSGISTITKTYGGTALNVNMFSNTCNLNFMHNTVVGNSATFLGDKKNFCGAAISAYNGTIVFQNNLIAGNYSMSGLGDLYVDATTVISKDIYNLFTSDANVNITRNVTDIVANNYELGVDQLATALDGDIQDSRFVANVGDNGGFTPTVKVKSPIYGDNIINCLSSNLRFLNSGGVLDLDGTGKTSGYLKIDQRGRIRQTKACIGAYEYYLDETAINELNINNIIVADLGNGIFSIKSLPVNSVVGVYNVFGNLLSQYKNNTDACAIDLSEYSNGIYLLSIGKHAFKVIR